MKSLRGLSFEDVAFEVCSAFERAGVLAVLTGGGAATIYATAAYQTRDLDFVLHLEMLGVPGEALLRELGFKASTARGTYDHPEIPYTLEILRGPLAVGEETITSWVTLHKGDRVLHVISPTDAVRDRLAAAIHFRDLSSARQAAEVAKRHEIDFDLVEAWCRSEGGEKVFAIFKALLGA